VLKSADFPANDIFRKFPEKNFIFPLAFSEEVCYYINVVSAIRSLAHGC